MSVRHSQENMRSGLNVHDHYLQVSRYWVKKVGALVAGLMTCFILASPPASAGVIEEIVEHSGWQTNRFPGPFGSIETACREEVYLSGYPNGNYVNYALAPQYSAFACYCHSNPAPSICGFVNPICPTVGGEIVSSGAVVVGDTLKCKVKRTQLFFVSTLPPTDAQCGATCNDVGDPINPASGAVYDTVVDLAGSGTAISFRRFYTGAALAASGQAGWRHSFSRSVKPRYSSTYRPHTAQSDSPLYGDEASACTDGFSQLRARVSSWTNATASYSGGICVLRVGSIAIGSIQIYSTVVPPPNNALLVGFDTTSDDGRVVRFTLSNGVPVPPTGVTWRLQQTASGYTLTDDSNAVESYDITGRLLSVTTRAGVVQTMTYDVANRLSMVSDSLGHRVTLTYDGAGRLFSVASQ